MNILLSDDKIIQEIKMYPVPNWIWIEIWEMSQYEIQVVITVNEEESCHLGQHKVIHICSAEADNIDDIIHFLRREMLDFTAFPVFFVSNLLLVQCKKYYFNRATVSRNCSIVL